MREMAWEAGSYPSFLIEIRYSPAGRYVVFVQWVWGKSSTNNDAEFQITVDGTPTNPDPLTREAKDITDKYEELFMGELNPATDATHDIALQYRNESSGTITVYSFRLYLYRIS